MSRSSRQLLTGAETVVEIVDLVDRETWRASDE
jgi:hypothetical protein